MKKIILIEGMHCNHCTGRVNDTLASLPGVEKVKVDLKKKNAVIKCNDQLSNDTIKNSITKLGFEVLEIKEK